MPLSTQTLSSPPSNYEYLIKILKAPIYNAAVVTDLNRLATLSSALGNEVYLKREDQQPVKSFKLRGAFNCMSQLNEQQKAAGVVAASAGNHAQGVAYAAKAMNIKATIVMPDTTPEIKVNAVRTFGGKHINVVQYGTSYDQASAHALMLSQRHGFTMIPPFDHPDVIAGQGTIAKEMLEQLSDFDYLFVAVGGGGLAAGMAVYLKQIKPSIKIIGVESDQSACLSAALAAGKPVTLPQVGIFADGVAVKTIGEEPFRLCKQYLDGVMTVTNDEICTAIKDIFDDTRVIAEPAGALSVAAIRKFCRENDVKNKRLTGILCGANINFHTLRYVSERCELGEQKEAVFAVNIPETKGAFKSFCSLLGGIVITEFNYRFNARTQSVGESATGSAQIFVGVKLRNGASEYHELLKKLDDNGYTYCDLSQNELAKLHVRHMVGGRPHQKIDESIFSFSFPEYPGALMHFLNTLGESWNITLFHYRNHGAAQGLVLAGFEIGEQQRSSFQEYLDKLDFEVQEHKDDPAYTFFLSSKG
ncbi:PLP-dependent threonine dehydratase [Glaciecola punicea]|jgi:threonine dehydratase|uniref:threonine ammonia-lyase, biosynthetic n=1 Tax=Glaciecola punicea TaxID=56804 RepID=UPI00068E0E14|nr:threonine ammonia-lyase, biosynthetic [Glaciecola punicea]OFA31834.1 PLP-dependent threonine dehydratase [Glaciecola punicea]